MRQPHQARDRLFARRSAVTPAGASLAAAVLLWCCLAAALAPPGAGAITRNATVAHLVAEAGSSRSELQTTVKRLSGVTPAPVGGSLFTILTRHAGSGRPIAHAEQYVYERLQSYGLDSVTYEAFSGAYDRRNVIGEITGTTRPGEIVVLCAHLDDMAVPPSRAPGADDNASGVAALLHIAKAFAPYSCGRTLRFVFTGDEEEGYDGSREYAGVLRAAGANVVAVIDADMLAYDSTGRHKVELHTRPAGAGDRDIWMAARYLEAASTYGLTFIKPHILRDAAGWSDHSSFWHQGYGATCLIESWTSRCNPYYHSKADTVSRFSWRYYLTITQGLTATAAHLAWLQGTGADGDIFVRRIGMSGLRTSGGREARATVTVVDSTGTPVEGARVTGSFTGASARTASSVTNGYGRARLRSWPVAGGGAWKFTVTGVGKSAWTYDPSRNVVSSASITVR